MIRKEALLFLPFIVLTPLSSFANDNLKNCQSSKISDGNQPALNLCAAEIFEHADKKLNAVYQKALKCFPDNDLNRKNLLKNAQRAWLIYRDAQAEYNASTLTGGQAYSMEYNGALTNLTQKRINELTEIMKECHSLYD